jgi:hypothetical protein
VDDEPIPHHKMTAQKNKFIAGAGVDETKMILSWLFNFHSLVVSLPTNKHISWSEELRKIIEAGETTAKELVQMLVDLFMLGKSYLRSTGSKFRKNSGRNSGSGPSSGIFGPGVAGIIFLGIAFFRTF